MTQSPADLSPLHLRCFVAVVSAGSCTEAGRQLGIATCAFSKTTARFEESQGVRLLHRSTHALSLTEDSELLIDVAQDAVSGFDRVKCPAASLWELGRCRGSTTRTSKRIRLVREPPCRKGVS